MGYRTKARKFVVDKAILLSRKRRNLMTDTEAGRHRRPFEEKSNILGFTLNRQGRTQDCLEDGM